MVKKRIIQQGTHSSNSRKFLGGIVGVGVVLCLAQYLFNRSLWSDEVWPVLNIIDRSWGGLLQPLDYDQGAPFGFLVIVKLLVLVFGDSEYILRLFPLLCGLLSLVLFYKVLLQLYPDKPTVAVVALCLFAISERLIYYATECKQYSNDVLVSLLILYVMLPYSQLKRLTIARIAFVGVFGAIAVWCSHPAVFVFAGVGTSIAIFRIIKKDWPTVGRLAIVFAVWALSFLVYYAISLRNSSNSEYLLRFWSGTFMPFPPSSLSDAFWFVRHLFELIAYIQGFSISKLIGLDPPEVFKLSLSELVRLPLSGIAGLTYLGLSTFIVTFIFLVGCISAFLNDKKKWVLLISPVMVTLLASGLRKYPFDNRLILFFIPFLLLFIAEGVDQIRAKTKRYSPVIGFVFIGLLFLHPVLSAGYYLIKPRTVAEVRPVISYLREHRQAGDVLYVDGPAGPELLRYYRYDPKLADYIGRDTDMKDLAKLRGNQKAWVLFSDTTYVAAQRRQVDAFLHTLDSMGITLDAFKAAGAEVYLYNLNQTPIKDHN